MVIEIRDLLSSVLLEYFISVHVALVEVVYLDWCDVDGFGGHLGYWAEYHVVVAFVSAGETGEEGLHQIIIFRKLYVISLCPDCPAAILSDNFTAAKQNITHNHLL